MQIGIKTTKGQGPKTGHDVLLFVIDEQGNEYPLQGVVDFTIHGGANELVTAEITCYPAKLEICGAVVLPNFQLEEVFTGEGSLSPVGHMPDSEYNAQQMKNAGLVRIN